MVSRAEAARPAEHGTSPVRIGVTGHRILTDTARIVRGIEEALDRVQVAYRDRTLAVLSALAEGADRMVTEAVLRRPSARLTAVLPFEEQDYVGDFGPDGSPSRLHFDSLLARAAEVVRLPGQASREESYEQGGYYVVDQCDVLLAIWDGRDPQGRGGTGAVVARARMQSKPAIIVRAGNRKPGSEEPTSLGKEQGQVIAEGLPS